MQEFMLTEKETAVLLELLRAEARTLEPEIRRTDAREMKKRLRERLRTIDRLIERFDELGEPISHVPVVARGKPAPRPAPR